MHREPEVILYHRYKNTYVRYCILMNIPIEHAPTWINTIDRALKHYKDMCAYHKLHVDE